MESRPRAAEIDERCWSILGAAVDSRDLSSVRAVLKHSGYKSSSGKDNRLCMTLAIESGELEMVQALVAANVKPYRLADVHYKSHLAIRNNALALAGSQPDRFSSDLGRFGLFRLLLGSLSEADRTQDACFHTLQFILEEACNIDRLEVFSLLQAEGISLRVTPQILSLATRTSDEQLVRSLLFTKFPNIPFEAHYSGTEWSVLVEIAIEDACRAGHESIVRLLLLHGSNILKSLGHRRSFVEASALGNETIVRNFLEHETDIDATSSREGQRMNALLAAFRYGHPDVATLFVQSGAKVNSRVDSKTPLLLACEWGQEKICRMLLDNNADINLPDDDGLTPLSCAITYSFSNLARLLIASGADIHRTCSQGRTALWRAMESNDEAVLRLLIDQGANVNDRDNSGGSALEAAKACALNSIVAVLLENGAVE
jgi:ankyrin repeat protein